MQILGVILHPTTKRQALRKVDKYLRTSGQKMIFTPNPEMIVHAQRDSYFRDVLNDSHLNICDGIGIEMITKKQIKRIPGSEFFYDVCSLAEEKNKTVFLLGTGNVDTLEKAKKNLQKTHPNLRIVGMHPGPTIKLEASEYGNVLYFPERDNDDAVDRIIECAPEILFVAFGHEKQEKWIYTYLRDLPSVKVAMGIGGTLEFVSGKIKRAPKIIQKIGLEWFWRLILQPRRIRRIFTAVVIFPMMYWKKIKTKDYA